jgi:hypothetical protein
LRDPRSPRRCASAYNPRDDAIGFPPQALLRLPLRASWASKTGGK